jgi:hypothetical protein
MVNDLLIPVRPSTLDGSIVLWDIGPSCLDLDVVTTPDGAPLSVKASLPFSPFAIPAVVVVDRWTAAGTDLRFHFHAGPRGVAQVKISEGPTWLLLDLVEPTSTELLN